MRKIVLHGFIGKKYGREFKFAVATAGEAVRALAANFPTILDDLKIGHWRIVRGDPKTGLHLDLEDVNSFNLGRGELHLIPAGKGSKRTGMLKTVLGVALVGVAVVASGGALGFATPLLGGLLTGGNLAMMGVAMTLAGVASMLAPKEHPKSNEAGQKADNMLGAINTYEQGNPIPLVYGETMAGSVVVSSGLTLTPYSMINLQQNLPASVGSLLGSGILTGRT